VAFALVHKRLLTPFVMTDHSGVAGIYALIRRLPRRPASAASTR
jgi:hypothetical protein